MSRQSWSDSHTDQSKCQFLTARPAFILNRSSLRFNFCPHIIFRRPSWLKMIHHSKHSISEGTTKKAVSNDKESGDVNSPCRVRSWRGRLHKCEGAIHSCALTPQESSHGGIFLFSLQIFYVNPESMETSKARYWRKSAAFEWDRNGCSIEHRTTAARSWES